MIDFAELITLLIKRKKLSYKQIGMLCGLSGRAISYYAKGERVPNVYDADKLLKALDESLILGKCGKK